MTEHQQSVPLESISPPGDTIADALEEKGWTQAELCTRLGYTPKHVSLLINGKAPITEDTALRLERVVGGDMAFWLNREALYREALARLEETAQLKDSEAWLKELPLSDMIRFKWIKRKASVAKQVAECLRYFGVASVEAWRESYSNPEKLGLAYRASAKFRKVPGHVVAWLRQGEIETAPLDCKPFDAGAFRSLLHELRDLTTESDPDKFVAALTKRCSEVGVAVAFVPAPKGCPVCGVTRWLTPEKAMLLLSLRYKTNDHLWFTFFHEAGHILLHSKKMMFLELTRDGLDNKEEREADQFARDLLIPPETYESLRQSDLSMATIRDFASQIRVAPGIVVGRLQKDGFLDWSQMYHLKVSYRWPHE